MACVEVRIRPTPKAHAHETHRRRYNLSKLVHVTQTNDADNKPVTYWPWWTKRWYKNSNWDGNTDPPNPTQEQLAHPAIPPPLITSRQRSSRTQRFPPTATASRFYHGYRRTLHCPRHVPMYPGSSWYRSCYIRWSWCSYHWWESRHEPIFRRGSDHQSHHHCHSHSRQ